MYATVHTMGPNSVPVLVKIRMGSFDEQLQEQKLQKARQKEVTLLVFNRNKAPSKPKTVPAVLGFPGLTGDCFFGSGLGIRLGKKNSCELAAYPPLGGKASPILKNESS